MMSNIYRKPCFNSVISVKELNENEFEVCMIDGSNPLSSGTRLGNYRTEERAIEKADHFCLMYGLVREKGYHLRGNMFVKPNHEDLSVEFLLHTDVTQDQLVSLLEK